MTSAPKMFMVLQRTLEHRQEKEIYGTVREKRKWSVTPESYQIKAWEGAIGSYYSIAADFQKCSSFSTSV
jgi:hypothetical protein